MYKITLKQKQFQHGRIKSKDEVDSGTKSLFRIQHDLFIIWFSINRIYRNSIRRSFFLEIDWILGWCFCIKIYRAEINIS